nr:PaRep2a protein [Pyrobaculum aerophilum]
MAECGEKYAEQVISEYALRRAIWWDGEVEVVFRDGEKSDV